jgi:hypothetical protein
VGGGGRGRDQEGVVGDGQQSYWSKILILMEINQVMHKKEWTKSH